MDQQEWDRLPDRLGVQQHERLEWHDLLAARRRAVNEDLTDQQRRVFVAIALNGVPADAVALELGSNRNAIYKSLFDARRKLRASLAANGHLPHTDLRGP
jgi:RNA polymerase sigma-70 factor (ECF subfamily)